MTESGKHPFFQLTSMPIRDHRGYPPALVIRETATDRNSSPLCGLEATPPEAPSPNSGSLPDTCSRSAGCCSASADLIHQEKMSSTSQVVAGISHEINNPVNFIAGNLKYAEDYVSQLIDLIECYRHHYPEPVPEIQARLDDLDLDFVVADIQKLQTSMRVGADRMSQVVQSLRTFSRQDETEWKATDLHAGLDSTIMLLQHRLAAQYERPAIRLVKAYGEIPAVPCCASELNQAFMHLLCNAIEAIEQVLNTAESAPMADYDPEIRIRTHLDSNGAVSICITDNGCGIPAEAQTQIFNPFWTTKPAGKGSGMGLAISQQIVTERHRGTLKYQFRPNQGTQFIITLPIAQLSAQSDSEPAH
ncbi:ATP-binding protein [Alkalinema sp. FACHB-956]|uniref:sensor histidine kinase n=1 Tax=Alkalinema sp. FACHB-956 TaxID=2692768 RepID=UPI0016838942|nr:ATP-binding protein [Alkalinema sp. FACHB-956]MBD2328317.1 HAMP domain-containing histidine kinase [Alkalinema sp. FACHB-956]